MHRHKSLLTSQPRKIINFCYLDVTHVIIDGPLASNMAANLSVLSSQVCYNSTKNLYS